MGRLRIEYFLARRISVGTEGHKHSVMVRIATLSVVIGMAVMIISLAVIFGFKREISQIMTGFGAHVQIVNLDGNNSYETIPITKNDSLSAEIGALQNCTAIYPYAIKAGILRGENALPGIVLKGVDRSFDRSFFEKHKVAGEVPVIGDSIRNKDVMISRTLADLMQAEVGDKLEMLFIQEPPRRDRFRIAGIYETQLSDMDKVMILTDIRNVQRLNGWDSTQITGYEITTSGFDQLDPFTERVSEMVYDRPRTDDEELSVTNIKERSPMIFDWLDTHNVNAGVIITVMLLVALFNMITALLIILLERTSMIGILKALGMGNRALQKMFIIRSSFIIFKGMIWGNIVGVGLCLLQHFTGVVKLDQAGYFLTQVPILLEPGYLILLNIVTFAFIVLLLTLPTMIISLILPEKTIRFE